MNQRRLNPAERAVEEIRAVRRAIWRKVGESPAAILTRLMERRRAESGRTSSRRSKSRTKR